MKTHITDSNGRQGIITEARKGGLFVRPATMDKSIGFESGKLTTATFWARQPDGSLRGLWVDSKPHAFVTAHEA